MCSRVNAAPAQYGNTVKLGFSHALFASRSRQCKMLQNGQLLCSMALQDLLMVSVELSVLQRVKLAAQLGYHLGDINSCAFGQTH